MSDIPPSDSVPEAPQYVAQVVDAAPRSRPGGLTAICVIAIVLGSLGVATAVWGAVQLAVGQQIQAVMQQAQAGTPNEVQEIQQRMQDEINTVQHSFLVPFLILASAKFVLCGLMIVAAIMTLKLRPQGRQALLWLFSLIMLFEIANFATVIAMQLQMQPIMAKYMPEMMKSGDGGVPRGAEFGAAAAKIAIIVGMVFAGGWTLLKLLYYGLSILYLRKPAIRALFAHPPT